MEHPSAAQFCEISDPIRFPDECNILDRTLAHATGPAGGRWHLSHETAGVGARAVVSIRRRPGLRRGAFRSFVHDGLGASLARSPHTTEVRTHVFLPYLGLAWPTPGVAHDDPPHRRHHAAILIGAADRLQLERGLGSHRSCRHARYAGEIYCAPLIRDRQRSGTEQARSAISRCVASPIVGQMVGLRSKRSSSSDVRVQRRDRRVQSP